MFQSHSFTSFKALHAGWIFQPARVKLANTNTENNANTDTNTKGKYRYLTTFHGAWRTFTWCAGVERRVKTEQQSFGLLLLCQAEPCRADRRPSNSPAAWSSGHWRVREIQSTESKKYSRQNQTNTVCIVREIQNQEFDPDFSYPFKSIFVILLFVFLMAEKKLSSQRHNIALAQQSSRQWVRMVHQVRGHFSHD